MSTRLYDALVPARRDEMVQRTQSGTSGEDDPWVQVNVRMRRSMVTTLDARRKKLDLSRDEWMRHVVEWALLQPPTTPVRANGRRKR